MSALRRRAFAWAVPLILALTLAPAVLATFTTTTPKTVGGGFSGGTISTNNTWTGTNSFIDGNLSIVGSSDATKIAKFEVDGFTTANTRVFTLPGTTGNDTIATLANANVFTANQTFPNASAATPGVVFANSATTGLYSRAANVLDWSFNNSVKMEWDATALRFGSGYALYWQSNASADAGTQDTAIIRTATGVLSAASSSLGSGWFRSPAGELALNADYTNATATFSNTALSTSLISGRTYNFMLSLTLADSTAADGVKIDFNGGAATVTNFRVHCANLANTGVAEALTAGTSTTLAGVINDTALAGTTQYNMVCNGTIVPSSSNTFIVRAAQDSHSTGTLTIYRGSWISIRDANPL